MSDKNNEETTSMDGFPRQPLEPNKNVVVGKTSSDGFPAIE